MIERHVESKPYREDRLCLRADLFGTIVVYFYGQRAVEDTTKNLRIDLAGTAKRIKRT